MKLLKQKRLVTAAMDECYRLTEVFEWFLLGAVLILFIVLTIIRFYRARIKDASGVSITSMFKGFITNGELRKVTFLSLLLFSLGRHTILACDYDGVNLHELDTICYGRNSIKVNNLYQVHGLSHMYKTASFASSTTFSEGCVFGDCGNRQDCSSRNSYEVDYDIYTKKNCVVSPFYPKSFWCFFATSCQNLDQHIQVKDHMEVHSVGSGRLVSDLAPCRALLQIPVFQTLYLVRSTDDYLCTRVSEIGAPQANLIGDLQLLPELTANWDWNCDFRDPATCMLPISAAANIENHCTKLPGVVHDSKWFIKNNSLYSQPIEGYPVVDLSCPGFVILPNITHCGGLEAKMVGVEGHDNDMLMVRSIRADCTYCSLSGSCFEGFKDLKCDGEWHSFILEKDDKCTLNGVEVTDMRTMISPAKNPEYIPAKHLRYYFLWGVLAFLAIMIIRKLIVSILK